MTSGALAQCAPDPGDTGSGGAEEASWVYSEVHGGQKPIPSPPTSSTSSPAVGAREAHVVQVGPTKMAPEMVPGAEGFPGELDEILSADDLAGLFPAIFGLAAGGAPTEELFGKLEPLTQDGLLLTNEDAVFQLAAAMALLALKAGGSSEIAECAHALLECARAIELPDSEILLLASLPDEPTANRLAEMRFFCKEEHVYLLTIARGLHRERNRDFFGAAKIYSSMVGDEEALKMPVEFEDAIEHFFKPIEVFTQGFPTI